MKKVYLFALTLLAVPALAQTPDGFARKQKTARPTPSLAQRLGAEESPIPVRRAGRTSLAATGTSRISVEPLRLRVVRDTATGLPVYIENRQPKVAPTNPRGRQSAAAAAYQFLSQVSSLLKLDHPEDNFQVTHTETDQVGQTHIRMKQTYAGVPVYGGEIMLHLTNGAVTLLNGRYHAVQRIATRPRLKVSEAAEYAFRDVRKQSVVRSFGDNILQMKPSEGELFVYPVSDTKTTLAWQVTVRPNLLERWEYIIDAQTGEVLDKYNHTCGVEGTVKASGRDLNGVMQSFSTYQQGGSYYLIDATQTMFNNKTSVMPNEPVGAIWTIDAGNTYGDNVKIRQVMSTNNTTWNATAVSAHANAGLAYEYYLRAFNRNSLNGKGGNVISVINMADDDGKGMDNAFWNGKFMAYGNGRVGFKPLAGSLDVAGHEMTHGVVENTANLEYKGQSGAINESMADVFGVLIDRDDWTLGEEVVKTSVFPSGALRSLSNPNQGGKGTRGYQPKTMSEYVSTTEDNGGVHTNSGIPNYAFYLFASKVGKDKAEKVYYRALSTYLTRTSKFIDLRLAVIRAAGDLYGTSSAEVNAAKSAFDTVGILESSGTPTEKTPDVPVAQGQDLLLLYGSQDNKLYSTIITTGTPKFDLKTASGLLHRPSVSDDGKYAYYVTPDKKIRAVNLTGSPAETTISDETIWDNVAISKDGTKLGALTAEKDGSIWVYSYAKKKWKKFQLYNPTYTDGVATGDVQYADSFEWDFSGEYIVYDAYNELVNADGEAIGYWDVGFIHVWDGSRDDFAEGEIDKLFTNLEEGESVGNPSFSKNSPDIIAFDYYNASEDSYYLLAADLNKGNVTVVYENNTLGFPSYSRQDNRLVFSTEDGNGREDVAAINLAADKIKPSGNATTLYTNAKWPVWYTQGTRSLPTKEKQTITFSSISEKPSGAEFTLSASASSGLPVSFAVVSGPATITGNKVKVTGQGSVTIRAYQEGNTKYYSATPIDRTFAILTVTGTEPVWSDDVKVYPIPATTVVNVEVPTGETITELTLVNLTGGTIQQQRPGSGKASVDVSALPKGVYILNMQTPKGMVSRRVMK
ncbi:hypothetical protein GCM10023189_30630 [Nibrella saemangeumensis]|uniref:Por secretion system C-terminal sorting domain-containing protein n=1 Tax=Nibrella saemangeumensis TaxID=1084526 RepID=A0ABP8N0J5_9BACT